MHIPWARNNPQSCRIRNDSSHSSTTVDEDEGKKLLKPHPTPVEFLEYRYDTKHFKSTMWIVAETMSIEIFPPGKNDTHSAWAPNESASNTSSSHTSTSYTNTPPLSVNSLVPSTPSKQTCELSGGCLKDTRPNPSASEKREGQGHCEEVEADHKGEVGKREEEREKESSHS